MRTVLLAVLAAVARATEPPKAGDHVSASSNVVDDATLDAVGHGQLDRRYDYKQSLKKPFFVFPNHETGNKIPFYDFSGDALVTNDYVRLTPSLPNQSGALWREEPNQHKEFQIHFAFRASGRGYAGGEGLALWYTANKGVKGDVMGAQDFFKGLGLIFSTSSRKDNRFSPYIYAVLNDGTKQIASRTPQTHEILGGCMRDYRNTPHPVWVRVTYKRRQLRVDVDLYKDGYKFEECFRAKDVDLPPGYYFGATAKTGAHDVFDDHDVLGLEVFEVHPHPRKSKSKFQDEFKLDPKAEKNFKQAQAAVEEVQQELQSAGILESEGEAVFNPQLVQSLQENQFKIIEALNQLEQKVNLAPNTASASSRAEAADAVRSSVEPVNNKVEGIKKKIDELELKLDALDRDIQQLFHVIRGSSSQSAQKLSDIGKKVEEGHEKIKTAHEYIGSGAAVKNSGGDSGSFAICD
ncbi:hypothetical protein BCR33DRAFT_760983 [Rhizoclosmatium globosum]|uniref:L-type lectin-like domain-containing protein n=1 Tax=Rhizoclosmatium globosum TaxID=329046 RepID=A0A1Y2D4S2_9FUNG|nr:hypothetical protein BCR33DRAFT_760983 [Rhizoclosmatium globosum]|eukprot:ORY53585.1 hypothetical protein BCR33DRAFT_760983 [Rhizoclosmatium globosum]